MASSKGQNTNSGNNQGNKQGSNPNSNKQCHYCKNKGHIIAECRKKIWAEANNKIPKNNYQNNKNYTNESSFKYNPSSPTSGSNGDNKTIMRCNFCNIKCHGIANCRLRQRGI